MDVEEKLLFWFISFDKLISCWGMSFPVIVNVWEVPLTSCKIIVFPFKLVAHPLSPCAPVPPVNWAILEIWSASICIQLPGQVPPIGVFVATPVAAVVISILWVTIP